MHARLKWVKNREVASFMTIKMPENPNSVHTPEKIKCTRVSRYREECFQSIKAIDAQLSSENMYIYNILRVKERDFSTIRSSDQHTQNKHDNW